MKQLKSLKDLKYGLISVEQRYSISKMNENLFDTVQVFETKKHPNLETSKQEINSIIEIQRSIMSKPNWKEYYRVCKEIDENLFEFILNHLLSIGINIEPKYLKDFYNRYDSVILYLKNYFNRPRPYQLAYYTEQKLNNFNTISGHSPAYPSGHSFQGWLTCFLLMEKYPSKKNQLIQLAKIIEESRLVLGLHYPSDNEFGKTIAIELSKNKNI